jgi:hypothetical protein
LRTLLFALLLTTSAAVSAQTTIQTDVLIIGGGTGGTAAGIQAARMGARTIIAEPTTWLGGMMTAAGVSAIDGNHNLPSGLWAEFRNALYKHYGGPNKVATGWVSNTLFEPHVGDSIWKALCRKEAALSLRFQHRFLRVVKKDRRVTGAVFLHAQNKQTVTILARQVIDATELGDAFANAGALYDVGMEASSLTGEKVNIAASNEIIQDLTYVGVLKDYGPNADCTIVRPAGFDPAEFDGACTDYYNNPTRVKPSWDAAKMLNYGKLPNKKYMLNWPAYGNDYYLNLIHVPDTARERMLHAAKQQTLRFIYFIQHTLGYKHLGLANDEFPTKDRLALIPYHREGRRVKGLVRYTLNELAEPYAGKALYRTGISVGDYPVDQHHRKNPDAPQHLSFYPVPSFSIPLGALIPANTQGLIVAEKGISVSNAVNGASRLQPCVLLTGQAAGALAALAVKQQKDAANIVVRDVQDALIKAKAYLLPFYDIKPDHPHFAAAQRIGVTGILRGKGIPNAWANQTWLYPDSLVHAQRILEYLKPFAGNISVPQGEYLTCQDALSIVKTIAVKHLKQTRNSNWRFVNDMQLQEQLNKAWKEWGFGEWRGYNAINRIQMAKLLDAMVDPFHLKKVNHLGEWVE